MQITKCNICHRWFKVEQMKEVDVGDSLYIKRYVCTGCWTKIESGAGAEEPTLKQKSN